MLVIVARHKPQDAHILDTGEWDPEPVLTGVTVCEQQIIVIVLGGLDHAVNDDGDKDLIPLETAEEVVRLEGWPSVHCWCSPIWRVNASTQIYQGILNSERAGNGSITWLA
jgi:hypothetical protein